MAAPVIVLWASLAIDRLAGDPDNSLHPTAWLGRFIGWWGRPAVWPPALQRAAGLCCAIFTIVIFSIPFWLFTEYAPFWLYLAAAPFLLKITFAWRCLEEHVTRVREGLAAGGECGRNAAAMMVSRETSRLSDDEVLSAACESLSENLVDSIVSPLFFFTFAGLAGAAAYRAANTMDAMLGYRDERARIGWFAARLDDILNYIPARLVGLLLLLWFASKGRLQQAWRIFRRDARKRPGFNGGIPMSIIAGGVGVCFVKPGAYEIGDPEQPLADGQDAMIAAVRAVTIISALLFTAILYFIASIGAY
jgi:adenosylcobinamide-phosphate synthase